MGQTAVAASGLKPRADGKPLRVLIVEDSEDDAMLVLRELRRGGFDVTSERVETRETMVEALERQTWDIVISDYSMPHFDAPGTLSVVRASGLDLPVIIASGTVGEDTAVEALKAGASDFILKGKLARLVPAVRRELREKASRNEKRLAEDRAHQSEERYRLLFDRCPLPMWVYDVETLAFVAVNPAAIRHYGYSAEEFARMTIADIRPREEVTALRDDIRGAVGRDDGQIRLWRHRRKDGSIIQVEIQADGFELDGRAARLVLANDVTARERAQEALQRTEAQLRQSQKMDAIGRLAGGVSHDFNNILSVIISYGDMLLADLKPDDPIRADVDEIHKAGKRAADLTRQLLMFSRQQVIEPRVLDLNEVLTNLDNMLQRILGADVSLVSLRTPQLGRVCADPGGIEQVVMNLVVNARDAMPTGGQLTIETANVTFDEEYARQHVGAKPGPHVMLAVTDTGTGMDRATLARIFEPFFTTKGAGKGTGLGLSTVFGIVQQNGGTVWVYSEPGQGTTFKVYLPRVDQEVQEARPVPEPATLVGTETVLLVDDDEQVRVVTRAILLRHGYHVIDARNAGEALLLSESHRGAIHVLLTDVVMPQMSGPDLARRLAANRPAMKVLCMSGYTDDTIVRHGVIEARMAYLQKPVTPEVLTRKVRAVLDGT
jgi:two-component system, cell cycle sensor histidine kinase and response regulator CckA